MADTAQMHHEGGALWRMTRFSQFVAVATAHLAGRHSLRCLRQAPRHGFRFKNKLFSLDSSLIDLSLKVFPWARYALGKAAMNNRNHSAMA